MITVKSLKLERIGQITNADIALGDLTVLVGPQATGKSIFLQYLKLALDTGYVHDQLKKHGIDWKSDVSDFLDVYLGEGMRGLWKDGEHGSSLAINDHSCDMLRLATRSRRGIESTAFYIPAQRVLTLSNGWPRPFQGFAADDPFAVRDFSETFRLLMEQEFSRRLDLFPTNRLKKEYRALLEWHLFGGAKLLVDRHGAQKRLVLQQAKASEAIPFMAWSAGQREFVPLLMGLYWLMPATKTAQRGKITTVIIEEPEMGLHPYAISVVMLLVMELLWRGYRVCISTHSTQVLDVIWGLRAIQMHGAESSALLDIFDVEKTQAMRKVATAVLKKETRVYFFDRDGKTHDISELDPGAEDATQAGWGGLSEFSGKVNEIVASVMSEDQRKAS